MEKLEGLRAQLIGQLDAWAELDEANVPDADVRELYDRITRTFNAHPGEAEASYGAWRAAHPEARLA